MEFSGIPGSVILQIYQTVPEWRCALGYEVLHIIDSAETKDLFKLPSLGHWQHSYNNPQSVRNHYNKKVIQNNHYGILMKSTEQRVRLECLPGQPTWIKWWEVDEVNKLICCERNAESLISPSSATQHIPFHVFSVRAIVLVYSFSLFYTSPLSQGIWNSVLACQ